MSVLLVADTVRVDAQELSNLSLEESKVESALADMVPEGFEFFLDKPISRVFAQV